MKNSFYRFSKRFWITALPVALYLLSLPCASAKNFEEEKYDKEVILNFMGGKNREETEKIAYGFGLQQYAERRKTKYKDGGNIVRIDIADPNELEDPKSKSSQTLKKLGLTSKSRVMIIGHGGAGIDYLGSDDGQKKFKAEQIAAFIAKNAPKAKKMDDPNSSNLKVSIQACSAGLHKVDLTTGHTQENTSFSSRIFSHLSDHNIGTTVSGRMGKAIPKSGNFSTIAPYRDLTSTGKEYNKQKDDLTKQEMKKLGEAQFYKAHSNGELDKDYSQIKMEKSTRDDPNSKVTISRNPMGGAVEVFGRKEQRNDSRSLQEKELDGAKIQAEAQQHGITHHFTDKKNLTPAEKETMNQALKQNREIHEKKQTQLQRLHQNINNPKINKMLKLPSRPGSH